MAPDLCPSFVGELQIEDSDFAQLKIRYCYYYCRSHLCAGYSQLYTWNKPCFCGIYIVAAVLYLQLVLHGMLFGMLNIFCALTSEHAVVQLVEALHYKSEGRGFIPDCVIGMFHWPNPSSRIVALGSTQSLMEMTTRNISWAIDVAGT